MYLNIAACSWLIANMEKNRKKGWEGTEKTAGNWENLQTLMEPNELSVWGFWFTFRK